MSEHGDIDALARELSIRGNLISLEIQLRQNPGDFVFNHIEDPAEDLAEVMGAYALRGKDGTAGILEVLQGILQRIAESQADFGLPTQSEYEEATKLLRRG